MTFMEKLILLVVEDPQGNKQSIEAMVAETKYSASLISVVTSLKDALDYISKNKVDLILLDLNLPDSRGLATFNSVNIKADNVSIIVFTDDDDKELGNTILRLGAKDHLDRSTLNGLLLSKSIEYTISKHRSGFEIRKQEKNFKSIIEKNADGMVVTDDNGIVLYVNPVAEKLLSVTSEELIGTPLGFELRKNKISEERIVDAEGSSYKIIQLNVVEALWDNTSVKIATLRDITELKQNQDRIEQLNRLLKTISNINHLIVSEKDKVTLLKKVCVLLTEGRDYKCAWIGLLDKSGNISDVVQSGIDDQIENFKRYLSSCNKIYCVKEVINIKGVLNVIDTAETCGNCPLAKLYTNKGGIAVKISHNGTDFGILVVSHPSHLIQSEEEDHLMGEVASDIGLALHTLYVEERDKISQEKLLWLDEALKEAANAVVLTDTKGNIEWVNPAFTKLTGYEITEAEGKNPRLLKSGKHDDKFYADLWDTITSGKIWKGEMVNKRKDGILYTEEMTITPVKKDSGEISRFIAIKSDVTERKDAEKKLKESEERYRGFFENATIGLYRTLLNGEILDANIELVNMLGFSSPEQMINALNAIENYADKSEKAEFDEIMNREGIIHGYETVWLKADGTPIHVQESARTVYDDNGRILYYEGAVVDITEQKIIQEQIKKSELQFRTIWENSFDGMRLTDEKGVIVQVNEAFCTMAGMERDELIGHTFEVAYKEKNKESVKRYIENFKTEHIKRNLDAEVTLSSGETKWVSLSNSFIYVRNKKLLLSIFRDITKNKEHENELMDAKEKAETSDRLKSEFLAQMSHEIRTPLNTILSFTELLLSEVNDKVDNEFLENFGIIDSAGKRVIRTIDLILNMSQLQAGSFEIKSSTINFYEDIAKSVFVGYKSAAEEKKIDFQLVRQSENCSVKFDEYCAYQIATHLIDNAIKFTHKGFVKVSVKDENEKLSFIVEDSGVGISQDYLPGLFEPFTQEQHGYTREYDGNGLGLTLVKKFCEINNSQIDVKSIKGKGSTFKIVISR